MATQNDCAVRGQAKSESGSTRASRVVFGALAEDFGCPRKPLLPPPLVAGEKIPARAVLDSGRVTDHLDMSYKDSYMSFSCAYMSFFLSSPMYHLKKDDDQSRKDDDYLKKDDAQSNKDASYLKKDAARLQKDAF